MEQGRGESLAAHYPLELVLTKQGRKRHLWDPRSKRQYSTGTPERWSSATGSIVSYDATILPSLVCHTNKKKAPQT